MNRALTRLMLIASCLIVMLNFSGVDLAVAQSSLGKCPDGDGVWNNCFGKWSNGEGYTYEGEWQNNKQNGQGTQTVASGEKYVGEFRDGKLSGRGTYTFPNGEMYIGEFRDDMRNGQGTLTLASGERYVGGFKDDLFNGQGTYTYKDGQVEVGEFKDGKLNGLGTQTLADGTKYVGEFKDDKRNGQFTVSYANGDKYVGEFKDNLFNGRGVYTTADGGRYEGEYLDDKPNGQGKSTWGGAEYIGEFKEGKLNGQFSVTYANGDSFNGRYQNEKRDGHGTYLWRDGSKYAGQWKVGLPTTEGILTNSSGSSIVGAQFESAAVYDTNGFMTSIDIVNYNGDIVQEQVLAANPYANRSDKDICGSALDASRHNWNNHEAFVAVVSEAERRALNIDQCRDILRVTNEVQQQVAQSSLQPCPTDQTQRYDNCYGKWSDDEGNTYDGEWKEDKPHGYGTYTHANGDKSAGEFKDGLPNGRGSFTLANGDKYVGDIKDGKPDGGGTYIYASGDKYVGEFKEQWNNGHFSVTYANGDSFMGVYQSDRRNGQGVYSWKDGSKYVGQWKHGLPTNEGILTNSSGSAVTGAKYNSAATYDADGYMTSPDTLTYAGGTVQQPLMPAPDQQQQKPTASSDNGRRLALVVGIDNYQHIDALQKAVNDSKAISDTLKKIGYDVLSVQDADRRTMSQKLQEFQSKIQPGDTAFFFFAGHGVALGADNILLAADVPSLKPGQDDIAKDEGFSVDNIVRRIQKQGAKTAMLVLDACRNNPFETDGIRSVGTTRGLTKQETPEGVFVLFSAGLGQGALDRLADNDPDPNSVFTRKLIPALLSPRISHIDLAKQVQADVAELAATVNVKQQPAYYDQIMGRVLMNNLQ